MKGQQKDQSRRSFGRRTEDRSLVTDVDPGRPAPELVCRVFLYFCNYCLGKLLVFVQVGRARILHRFVKLLCSVNFLCTCTRSFRNCSITILASSGLTGLYLVSSLCPVAWTRCILVTSGLTGSTSSRPGFPGLNISNYCKFYPVVTVGVLPYFYAVFIIFTLVSFFVIKCIADEGVWHQFRGECHGTFRNSHPPS